MNRKLLSFIYGLIGGALLLALAGHAGGAQAAEMPLSEIPDSVWDRQVQANLENSKIYSSASPSTRGRLGLILGQPQLDGEQKFFQVKLSSKNDLGCGSGSLESEFLAIMDFAGLAQEGAAMLQGAVKNAALLLICYYSPTICSQIKSVRSWLNQAMAFKSSQCAAVQKFIDARLKDASGEAVAECVRRKGGGLNAQQECLQERRESESPWSWINMQPDENGDIPVVRRTLEAVFVSQYNLSEEEAAEKAGFLTSLFGDVLLKGDGSITSPPTNARKATEDLRLRYYKEYAKTAEKLADKLAQKEEITQADLEPFSGYGIAPTAEDLMSIGHWLGAADARATLYKLADLQARARTLSVLREAQASYSQALKQQKSQSHRDAANSMIRQIEITIREIGPTQRGLEQEAREIISAQVAETKRRVSAWIDTGTNEYVSDALSPGRTPQPWTGTDEGAN